MHSFTYVVYVDCLNKHVKCIGQTFRTVLPSGNISLSSYWLRVVLVVTSERGFCAKLVMLDMTD